MTCVRRSTRALRSARWFSNDKSGGKSGDYKSETDKIAAHGHQRKSPAGRRQPDGPWDAQAGTIRVWRQSPRQRCSGCASKAVDESPDLLVCDYRLPGMDGRQLVEKLKSRPTTAGIASHPAGQQSRHQRTALRPGFRRRLRGKAVFPERSHSTHQARDRPARAGENGKAAPSDGVLRGNLSQMNVIDLVQSLEMGRKSCLLTMTNTRRQVRGVFQSGTSSACRLRFALRR